MIPTAIDCKAFPANAWIHLVWNLERIGNLVHYVSLTVGDQAYPLAIYYPNQAAWTLEEIDNAFQMDLDEEGDTYNVNEVLRPTFIPCNHFPSNTWIHLMIRQKNSWVSSGSGNLPRA